MSLGIPANNNEFLFSGIIDHYNQNKINLGIAFDRFLESNLFCQFIWEKEHINRESKDFFIGFVKKENWIEKIPPEEVLRFYRDIHNRISINTYEISRFIPFFGRFIRGRSEEFQESFTKTINSEIHEYINSIFLIYFNSRGWNEASLNFISNRSDTTRRLINKIMTN